MDSSAEYHPYVFRVLPLPVEFAQVAFDLAPRRVEAEAGSERATRWGRLELAAAARDTPAGYAPWRRAAGTLRAGRRLWPRVPVELALLPWSATCSELGLTALTWRWPPPGPTASGPTWKPPPRRSTCSLQPSTTPAPTGRARRRHPQW